MWLRFWTLLVLADATLAFPLLSFWRRSLLTSPYPVTCTTLADADHSKGNLTLSSVVDDSYTHVMLQAGPSTDGHGHPLLNIANDPSFPEVEFRACNSSYMRYESNQTDNLANVLSYG